MNFFTSAGDFRQVQGHHQWMNGQEVLAMGSPVIEDLAEGVPRTYTVWQRTFFGTPEDRDFLQLMCGPRVPCLQTLRPPRSTHEPLPRTRQQVRIANGHSFQLSSTLPPRSQNAVRRSFPYLYIPIWNSLPPSVLRGLSLKQLQRFKSEAYKYFLKNDWMWATQAYP